MKLKGSFSLFKISLRGMTSLIMVSKVGIELIDVDNLLIYSKYGI